MRSNKPFPKLTGDYSPPRQYITRNVNPCLSRFLSRHPHSL